MSEGDPYENDEFVQELLAREKNSQNEILRLQGVVNSSGVASPQGNLIQYQLDSSEMLEKLEHFYRGDYIGICKEGENKGEQMWISPDNKDLIPLNEFGVNSMMEIVTKYIDKNTSLSYYSEERIYEILADLGDEMVLVLFCNYEKMGMDTYFKKTKFRVMILTTLHMIESNYRRAIRGKTMEDLNQSKIVTQSDMVGARAGMGVGGPAKKSYGFLDPRRYMR